MFKSQSGKDEAVTAEALNNEYGFEFLARVIRVLDIKHHESFEPDPGHGIHTYKDLAMFLLSQASILGHPSDQELAKFVVEAADYESHSNASCCARFFSWLSRPTSRSDDQADEHTALTST